MSEEDRAVVETAKEKALKEVAEKNAKLSGVGKRWKVGATRGKNPTIIQYEVYDDSQPDTLPKSVAEFMEVETSDQSTLLQYLIRGKNADSYEAASDPLGEYVSSVWSPDVQLTFRTAVRNYSKGLGIELEDAVNIIRPGFAAKFGA